MSSILNRFRGSSPHTRGAPKPRVGIEVAYGIIPAYAGSTEANSLDGQTMADHPRIRGEHQAMATSTTTTNGSSPHTRGARADEPRHRRRKRIIPAYAGSTRTTWTR